MRVFNLSKEDIERCLAPFGELLEVKIDGPVAEATFSNIAEAFCAQSFLNGYYLQAYGAALKVKFISEGIPNHLSWPRSS